MITAHNGCEGIPDHTLTCIRKGIEVGAAALNAPYKYTPDELIAKMRARNVDLSLWTLNEEAALREFMQKDLLNITTRTVSLALAVRNA